MKNISKYALINALSTALYIAFIVSLIYFFGNNSPKNTEQNFLFPIAMLMLFVFSAALTGLLVFGRPIAWYLEGKKKEALSLIIYTLGIFLIITIIVFLIILLVTFTI